MPESLSDTVDDRLTDFDRDRGNVRLKDPCSRVRDFDGDAVPSVNVALADCSREVDSEAVSRERVTVADCSIERDREPSVIEGVGLWLCVGRSVRLSDAVRDADASMERLRRETDTVPLTDHDRVRSCVGLPDALRGAEEVRDCDEEREGVCWSTLGLRVRDPVQVVVISDVQERERGLPDRVTLVDRLLDRNVAVASTL